MALKARSKFSHKGQNGKVLIIGGSVDYPGSPTFVGMAAMATIRAGADLVVVAAPEKVAWAINCVAPDLITRKIKGDNFTLKNVSEILKLCQWADVIAIGNGIAFTKGAKEFITLTIKGIVKMGKPLVVDAAALRVVKIQDLKNTVLLPHEGELSELLKNSKLTHKNVQKKLGTNVLVMKGHPKTIILSKTKKTVNATGNAGMTHGGTGDVLCGVIGGLLAQGNSLFESAKVGAYANGKAADRLLKKTGLGYIASDLIDEIPLVLKPMQRIK